MRGGNPWIFSGAIERAEPPALKPGAWVEILDHRGALIGAGCYNPATTIAVRVAAWGESPDPDELIPRRLEQAAALRRRVVGADSDCYRLVNGEGDALPGIVVDRYGDVLVAQFLTAGAERMRDRVVSALLAPRSILERSRGAVRRQEGLDDRAGVLLGEPVGEVVARENGMRLVVDLARGQKTGCFLDQRDNRRRFGALAGGARVLDAYCYSGGFALAALSGGARQVAALDTSARALSLARRAVELNGLPAERIELLRADAPRYLAQVAECFDLIVLDPPALARARRDAERAGRLYAEINALALRALAPGGCLMSFSCSVHLRGEDFLAALRAAQSRAGRRMRLLARLGAGPDHPVMLGHLEGEYLTGALLGELG